MNPHFFRQRVNFRALVSTSLVFAFSAISGIAQNPDDPGPVAQGDGVVRNDPGTFDGYTLISPLQSTSVYLFDMEGRVVHTWETDFRPASMAYLLENGNILRPGEQPNPPWGSGAAAGGRLQEYTWDGELVWEFSYATDIALPHHDIARLPNGNVLMLIKEKVTAEEAIAWGRPAWSVEGTEIQMDSVIEVKPVGKTGGEIVWSWHLKDHLIQDYDAEKEFFGDVGAQPELVDINYDRGQLLSAPDAQQRRSNSDWNHINAIDYNADLDQIVMSVHEFSEIWIIDHSTTTEEAASHSGGRSGKGGDLLYRWGNPMVYRQGNVADQTLFSQHDSNWIPNGLPGEGHLMIFNNGNNRPGGNHSTADEIVLPVDENGNYTLGTDGKYGPESATWSYAAPNPSDFFSNFISGTRRLPNGNTIIASGASGIVFEVTPDNRVVWQFNNPSGAPAAGAGPGRGARGQGRGAFGGQGGFAGPGGAGGPGGPGTRGARGGFGGGFGGRGAFGGRGGGGGFGGPNARSVFRAYRYAPDYPGLAGKTLTPGKTVVEIVQGTE